MNATNKTPAGGRGLQDYAKRCELAAQLYGKPRSYCGCTPPNPAPAPRDPLTIAHELYAAAECLADLAEDFAAGEYDARALSSADALLIGCGRLVCELRARRAREAA